MPFTVDLSSVGPFTRRYRRPLAAASAGLAVLLMATAFLPTTPTTAATSGPSLSADEVAMPLTLAAGGDALQPGSVIDIVAVPELGTGARIVARDARVLSIRAGSGFAGGSGTSIVIAIPEADALVIADAGAAGTLSALIHAGP